ncbi:MAG: NYN domain-containing protein [Planctomycetota bacterium]|nr:NYN domain-containing protein [Planctomycetota bacterium]
MSLIIDTYNVLHVTGVLPPEIAGIDAAGLIDLIRQSRYRHRRTTLVCDGTPAEGAPVGRIGPVTVRYGGPGPTADALIATIIRRSSSPRRLTIVSSDRAVQREGRRRRCEVLSSEQFLEHLAADHEQAEAGGAKKPDRPPTPEPGPDESAGPPSGNAGSAGAAVLPSELVSEAEAILREGLPEEPEPPSEDKADAGGSQAGSETADDTPPDRSPARPPAPERPREPALPRSLVREALAMARAEGDPATSGPADAGDTASQEDDAGDEPPSEAAATSAGDPSPPAQGLDLPANLRAEDVLPPDIIREAESLLNDERARDETDRPADEEPDAEDDVDPGIAPMGD